jgi:O-antigen ligase
VKTANVPETPNVRARPAGRLPPIYRLLDKISGFAICFMIVFSPWAFGTTQRWSIDVMNASGFLLGLLLLAKSRIRRLTGIDPRRRRSRHASEGTGRPQANRMVELLGGLTILILGYIFLSAVNARATYDPVQLRFDFRNCINWLPHSYDSRGTWRAFWEYSALALAFWAIRDWLLTKSDEERAVEEHIGRPRSGLPARLKLLLWVVCVNGALVALQGILQRVTWNYKLLWILEPRYRRDALSSFGPYNYRANAAQFLNLIWPVALGFWWQLKSETERRGVRQPLHHLLLPIALVCSAGAVMTLSRGGAIVATASLLVLSIIWIAAVRHSDWRTKVGAAAFLATTISVAAYLSWSGLEARFRESGPDLSGRTRIYALSEKIVADYPWFGTGPQTYEQVMQLYVDRESPDEYWPDYAHNDWLQTRVTFGRIGLLLITAAMIACLLRWFGTGGIRTNPLFTSTLWVALIGCLSHAKYDLPLQINSILFLCLVLCAILFSTSRKRVVQR